jgi:hypothetical protein
MLSVLVNKFAQPSSWAGLAGLLGLLGVNVPDSTVSLIVNVGAGLCGLAAIVINEREHVAAPPPTPPAAILAVAMIRRPSRRCALLGRSCSSSRARTMSAV